MTETVHAIKFQQGIFSEVDDCVTVEEILHIHINEQPFTLTMRKPGNEFALVRGILLSEDVLDLLDEPDKMEIIVQNEKQYITLINLSIAEKKLKKGIQQQRNLISVSSCGMCGKEDVSLALDGAPLTKITTLLPEQILKYFDVMAHAQQDFKKTGGCHAAAIFDLNGTMLSCMEDIGRHNAVDKAIGQLLINNILQQANCLVVSGRISYEIVSKCYKANIPYLASVSAPSSMAIAYCRQKGISLYAFCRQHKVTQYA